MAYRTTWNLGLLYKNDNDPQMEKDISAFERAAASFEKKYRGKNFISTPEKLHKALADAELLSKIPGGRPSRYFWCKMSLNSSDRVASARATQYDERLTKAQNRIAFFYLDIAKIPAGKQKAFLTRKLLLPYKHKLERIFRHAKHNLSEKEEQLMDLMAPQSHTMWVDGADRLLNEQTIVYEGKKIPLPKAIMGLASMKKADRRKVHTEITRVLRSISHFAESELNAIYTGKKVSDELRGYAKPYSATVLGYDQSEAEVEALVSLVTKYFELSKRFYKLHAKLLGEKKITVADRAAKMGEIKKKFDFDTSVDIVRKEFEKIDPRYAALLDRFLKGGNIDAYPKQGKSGGAFCYGSYDKEPTYILLNHTDDIGSVETIAHEMGHAIHTELSKSQPTRYQHYSTAVAETASNFFEQAVSAALENHLSEKEKIILLHNKIIGDISSIFRQVALFNFETELHTKIRKEGFVAKEEIARLLNKHMQSYVGPTVEFTEDDGYFFVYWSHIRRFFYVYSYAYGQLISRALYENWKKDPTFATKIEKFLSAGSSMSPYDIFKSIGIDTRDPKFFEAGLKGIEADINRLEKLTKKA